MKSKIFCSEINEESIVPLLDFIESNPGEKRIYLCSDGGNSGATSILLDVMTRNQGDITLIAYDNVFSNAFRLFKSFNGRKYMVDGCEGMIHLQTNSLPYAGPVKYAGRTKSVIDTIDYCRERNINEYANLINDEEFEAYKEGQDVFFSFQRMTEMFPDVPIIW